MSVLKKLLTTSENTKDDGDVYVDILDACS